MFRFAFTVLCVYVAAVAAQTEVDLFMDYHLKYQLTNDNTAIEFQVTVRTTGWVGFGVRMGNIPGLIDSDLIMGGVDAEGNAYFNDMYADAKINDTYPIIDDVEDWFLDESGAAENATHTTLSFSRLLNTKDTTQDFEIKNAPINVIWSYGETDDKEVKHVNRGSRDINFLATGEPTTTESATTTESVASKMDSLILIISSSLLLLNLSQ